MGATPLPHLDPDQHATPHFTPSPSAGERSSGHASPAPHRAHTAVPSPPHLFPSPPPSRRFSASRSGAAPHPRYAVLRTRSAFPSRRVLLRYEAALEQAVRLDDALQVINGGGKGGAEARDFTRTPCTPQSLPLLPPRTSFLYAVLAASGLSNLPPPSLPPPSPDQAGDLAAAVACTEPAWVALREGQNSLEGSLEVEPDVRRQASEPSVERGRWASESEAEGNEAGGPESPSDAAPPVPLPPHHRGAPHAAARPDASAAVAVPPSSPSPSSSSSSPPLFLARFCEAWVHAGMCTVGVSLMERDKR